MESISLYKIQNLKGNSKIYFIQNITLHLVLSLNILNIITNEFISKIFLPSVETTELNSLEFNSLYCETIVDQNGVLNKLLIVQYV